MFPMLNINWRSKFDNRIAKMKASKRKLNIDSLKKYLLYVNLSLMPLYNSEYFFSITNKLIEIKIQLFLCRIFNRNYIIESICFVNFIF